MCTNQATSCRYDVIEKLRLEVERSESSLLDREIIDRTVIEEAAEAFRISYGSKTVRCNIPIQSIVSLDRKNDTWIEGDTWRDVVVRRLHGADWPETVFEYFENRIGERSFPPPGSKGKLELTCYGGISICSNGNHRLAAAYCWLASTQGKEAQLKDVITTLVPIDYKKVKAVLAAAPDSHTNISVCTTPSPCLTSVLSFNTYLRMISRTGTAYFALSEDLRLLWPQRRGPLQNIIRFLSADLVRKDNDFRQCLEVQKWIPLPRRVLDSWAACEWFNAIYA